MIDYWPYLTVFFFILGIIFFFRAMRLARMENIMCENCGTVFNPNVQYDMSVAEDGIFSTADKSEIGVCPNCGAKHD